MIELKELGEQAVKTKYLLQKMTEQEKNSALLAIADSLIQQRQDILTANEQDVFNAKKAGMQPGMTDRLKLNEERIAAMAEGLREIAKLPDPVGEVMEQFTRPNGLYIEKRRVPLGVIGIIYESRPNVTADAFGLCFKTGNAVILKGGSDAILSNQAIVRVIQETLRAWNAPEYAVQLITDTNRSTALEFMKMNEFVDVLIPRGGAGLIRSVVENSTIPVIETGTGNCHIYVDKDADLTMAVNIIVNAKTQRISVCNACESLLIHKDVLQKLLPVLSEELKKRHVEMRGDSRILEFVKDGVPATKEDYGTEYLDYIISMKTVDSVEEAIAHINHYNTGHSESIITENRDAADRFLEEVDAACVYVNASTRFTDGYEFGFGAEIGISTQKLHARGPMGLKELTSYKYAIRGNGQIRQ
jgi:glutamate-5-semialdehyde dehydrogenase